MSKTCGFDKGELVLRRATYLVLCGSCCKRVPILQARNTDLTQGLLDEEESCLARGVGLSVLVNLNTKLLNRFWRPDVSNILHSFRGPCRVGQQRWECEPIEEFELFQICKSKQQKLVQQRRVLDCSAGCNVLPDLGAQHTG